MFPVLDRFWSTRHQYGTEVFLGNRPLLLRESKPVLHGEFWKHPGEHQSKYYLRDSNGHPSFGGAVFRLHVCYIHSYTTPQAHSINAFSLLPNPLVHTTYASPVSWFFQEYALLATCILSSITQLFFGILFHTHCSRYPVMHNFAKPYHITGKNTSTNLFSTCNTHPPPPALTKLRFSSVPYFWKPPRSGTPTLLGNPQILIIQIQIQIAVYIGRQCSKAHSRINHSIKRNFINKYLFLNI